MIPENFLETIEEYKELSKQLDKIKSKMEEIKAEYEAWMIKNNEDTIILNDMRISRVMRKNYDYSLEEAKEILNKKELWQLILEPNWKKLEPLKKAKLITQEEIDTFLVVTPGTTTITISKIKKKEEN